MSSVIEMHDIRKTYTLGENRYEALKGIDLAIQKGELVSIMGASGAGKSTLMNIIGLLDSPTEGKYLLDGTEVSTFSDDERSLIRNEKIGFVFQSFFLLPRLNALRNVMLPTIYHPTTIDDVEQRAHDNLKLVGMGDFWHHKPNELSGGQQQRVAIARSLMCNPAVILADEPTGALDTRTSEDVLNLFLTLNRESHTTIIIVTHDPDVAERTDRVFHIQDGRVSTDIEEHVQ